MVIGTAALFRDALVRCLALLLQFLVRWVLRFLDWHRFRRLPTTILADRRKRTSSSQSRNRQHRGAPTGGSGRAVRCSPRQLAHARRHLAPCLRALPRSGGRASDNAVLCTATRDDEQKPRASRPWRPDLLVRRGAFARPAAIHKSRYQTHSRLARPGRPCPGHHWPHDHPGRGAAGSSTLGRKSERRPQIAAACASWGRRDGYGKLRKTMRPFPEPSHTLEAFNWGLRRSTGEASRFPEAPRPRWGSPVDRLAQSTPRRGHTRRLETRPGQPRDAA